MRVRALLFAATMSGALFAQVGPEAAGSLPQVSTIYQFGGWPTDGGNPNYGGVTAGPDGVLYGAAQFGPDDAGIVYQLTPPAAPGGTWTESILYNFPPNDPISYPIGNVALGRNGALYGASTGNGFGGVWELLPPAVAGGTWTLNVIHLFTGTNDGDGGQPFSSPVFGPDGKLYGTTQVGGVDIGGYGGFGVVYELTPPDTAGGSWTERVIYRFRGFRSGRYPQGPVTVGAHQEIYGTTTDGGAPSPNCGFEGCGVVFQLTPPADHKGVWEETILHRFRGGPKDGADPSHSAVTIGPNGKLYGIAGNDGRRFTGVVFELAPPSSPGGEWTESILYNFPLLDTKTSGCGPDAAVLVGQDGALYGTAQFCGVGDNGSVFRLLPPKTNDGAWTLQTLHLFQGGPADGGRPDARLAAGANGVLYGTTFLGGSGTGQYGGGIVFQITR